MTADKQTERYEIFLKSAEDLFFSDADEIQWKTSFHLSAESSHLGKSKDRNPKVHQEYFLGPDYHRVTFYSPSPRLFSPLGCWISLCMLATSTGNLFHPLLVCFVREHLQMCEQNRFWSYIFKSEVVWGFSSEDNTVYLFIFLKHCCSSWSSPWHLIYHSASTEYSNTVLLLIFRCKQKPITTWQKKRVNIDLSAERNCPKIIQNTLWSTKYPLHGVFFFFFSYLESHRPYLQGVYTGSWKLQLYFLIVTFSFALGAIKGRMINQWCSLLLPWTVCSALVNSIWQE